MWRETVREALSKQCPSSLVRQIAEAARAPASYGRGTSIRAGRSLPGPKADRAHPCLEELGRATDPTPFLASTTQFAPLAGDRFDPMSAGAAVYGGVIARSDPDGRILDGAARFILDGDRADRLAVVTAAGVFVVDAANLIARRPGGFDPVLHVPTCGSIMCALRKSIACTPTSNERGTQRSLGWRSRSWERVSESST